MNFRASRWPCPDRRRPARAGLMQRISSNSGASQGHGKGAWQRRSPERRAAERRPTERRPAGSCEERLPEKVQGLAQARRDLVGERAAGGKLGQELRALGLEEPVVADLEVLDPCGGDVVELA